MRVRISAPPGLVTLVKNVTKVSPANAEGIASAIVTESQRCFIPANASMLNIVRGCTTVRSAQQALQQELAVHPLRQAALHGLTASRHHTIYAELCVSAKIDSSDAIEEQLFQEFGRQWAKDRVHSVVRFPAAYARMFKFDLRREAYCQRRFITDRSLHKLVATDRARVAWTLYCDALGIRLHSRPPIMPVPHYYSAYYDFYMNSPTPHFESQNFLDEATSVLECPEIQPYLLRHRAALAGVRDEWQSRRLRGPEVETPRYDHIVPHDYKTVARGDAKLSKVAANVARMTRNHPPHERISVMAEMTKAPGRKKIANNARRLEKWLVELK